MRAIPRRLVPLLALAALAAGPLPARSQSPDSPAEVRIERARPMRDRRPTLRFLRENRDFIRARFDRLRERPVERAAEAEALDPRYLAYPRLLAELSAARDSALAGEDLRRRHALFASVAELAALEAQLDGLERGLASQRGRLATLERDFAGDRRTELMVLVSGHAAGAEVTAVSVELEDGGTVTVTLDDAQREALRQGGMVEVFRGFVEPREQSVRVGLAGPGWPAGDTGWLGLDPTRDRLTLLRLDLSTASPSQGVASARAGTWVHAPSSFSVDG